MTYLYDEFIAEFNRVAPGGATICVQGETFQAGIEFDGYSYAVHAPFDPGIRSVKAHASGLAERLWDIVEAHHAARRISQIHAARDAEDKAMLGDYLKARRHGLLPERDVPTQVSQLLRTAMLTPKEGHDLCLAVMGRIRSGVETVPA